MVVNEILQLLLVAHQRPFSGWLVEPLREITFPAVLVLNFGCGRRSLQILQPAITILLQG